jgi:hypothetical protein
LFGEKKVDKNWYLDRRDISEEQLDDVKFMNNWVCLEKGIVEFKKVKKYRFRSLRRLPINKKLKRF